MSSYKICHLTSAHRYDDHRIYYKECLSLAQANYETHLVAPDAPNEIERGIHLHGIPRISNNRLLRMTKTVWNIYQHAVKINADLYHFHDPELITIGLILKMKGKKVIYDVHEDLPKTIINKNHIPQSLRKIISVLSELLENFASQYFDAIVTATPTIAARFTKLGRLAVDIKNYPNLTDLELPDLNWEQKEQAVCYLGSIGEQRGIFEMIAAIEQTDANLLLAGNFAYPDDRDRAMAMPGWKKVQYFGYSTRQDVSQILVKSIAGLVVLHPLANYLDALPVKMFEYMFAGIPIIASDFSLWKQIIEEYQCGICVDPLDPKAIGAAIQWIIENPKLARQMGENGRHAIEAKYNWNHERIRLLDLYSNLLQ